MSWFPNYQPVKNKELSEAALLAIGKAILIANEFEANCKYVLQIVQVDSYLRENGGRILEAFNAVFKKQLLAGTIKDLGVYGDITAQDIIVLERAKDARNYLAH